MKVQMDILTPFQRKSLKTCNPHPWQTLRSLSSRPSKLVPSKVLKGIPRRVRTPLPGFIQSYSSQRLITGLSSANNQVRSRSPKFFPSPAEFIKIPRRRLSLQNPQPENLPEIIFPQSLSFSIPSRSKASNGQSPVESDF